MESCNYDLSSIRSIPENVHRMSEQPLALVNVTLTATDATDVDNHLAVSSGDQLSEYIFDAIGYYLLMVVIVGTAGNSAVIFTFMNSKQLHKPTNLLIVNLSASDLIVALTGTPLSVYSTFNGGWMFGQAGCNFYGFINYYCGCISLNSLAAISIFRYLIVVKRSRTAKKITKRNSLQVIFIIHMYTLICSTPPLLGWNRFVLEGYRIGCDIDFRTKTPLYISYIAYMFVFLFFLPLGTIVYNYWAVFKEVRQHVSATSLRITSVEPGVKKQYAWRYRSPFLRQRTGIILLITVVVFLIAWLPYCIVSLWVLIGDASSVSRVATVAPSLFAKSSVIYNPFIYVMLNPQYRKALLGNFQQRRSCTNLARTW